MSTPKYVPPHKRGIKADVKVTPKYSMLCIIAELDGELHVLLGKERKWNNTFWCMFGGWIEDQDRTPADAALREGQEETYGVIFRNDNGIKRHMIDITNPRNGEERMYVLFLNANASRLENIVIEFEQAYRFRRSRNMPCEKTAIKWVPLREWNTYDTNVYNDSHHVINKVSSLMATGNVWTPNNPHWLC